MAKTDKFNLKSMFGIVRILGYDVTFLKLEFPPADSHLLKKEFSLNQYLKPWVCAYVRLQGTLKKEYINETYRNGRVVGIDTQHFHNQNTTFDAKIKDATNQISALIKEHQKQEP